MIAFDSFSFKGQKALVRVDFNVPLNKDLQITDDTRMRAALPTINHIVQQGGAVILMSHLGRPKEGPTDKYSLRHLLQHLINLLPGTPVYFADDCIGAQAADLAASLKPGEVLQLENLRFYSEEEKGDAAFAAKLARLGTVWVNDAFGTAHRAHASTAVMANEFLPEQRLFGKLMEAEVASAQRVLHQAARPFVAIIGGAKVSDKILIIENLLERATDIIIGGGMAYTFFKAQGGAIGNSLCEDDRLPLAAQLLDKAAQKGVRIHLPQDSVIANRFAADAETSVAPSGQIPAGWMGLDIGPAARAQFGQVIAAAKTILWNGPMGVFEMLAFQEGTKSIALSVASATQTGAFSLVGGGDSVAAINQFKLSDQVSYVSTGGGAMLEYFEGKVLPGIAAVTG
ncbi:MAG: phosphoglycerate kinase [Sphingomonadales bacterium]|nr:phosphoglycerate kinase [Sphingomonadales bacterium]